jgi:integrase
MTLSALQVKNAKPGAKLSDGGGLRLDVDRNGNASWVFRFKSPVTGRERYMGLGPLVDVPLTKARDDAQAARGLIREGKDPIECRNEKRIAAKVEAAKGVTFQAFADSFITIHKPSWKNSKHSAQWGSSLKAYAYPLLGAKAVPEITTEDIVKVLSPIWLTKKETAARVRGRIEKILDAATAKKLRTGPNPALLPILKHLLPAQQRKKGVKHHAALPYTEMPKFWKSLSTEDSDAARMLRFIVATACRFCEAFGMEEAEIRGSVWTVPPGRMKAGRSHVVPLTPLALAQLPFRPVSDVTIAKTIARHTSLPATCHGMRSTFRDWCGDKTDFPRDVAEMALAHVVGSDTENAYRRSTALAKRRALMDAWAAYCCGR